MRRLLFLVVALAVFPCQAAAQETVQRCPEFSGAYMDVRYGALVDCVGTVIAPHSFLFDGTAGDDIVIQATLWASASPSLCMSLYGPDDTTLTTRCDGAWNRISARLPGSGRYRIRIDSASYYFYLSLDRLQPPSPSARSIESGQTLSDRVDRGGDLDFFPFFASAGEAIMLRGAWRPDSAVVPCLELVTPDGNRTTACQTGTINHIDTTVTVTGWHTVIVHDQNFDSTGEYRITAQRLVPSPADAWAFPYGSTRTDQIDIEGDADAFRFTGSSGDTVRINATSSVVKPCLELVAPDNTRATACDDQLTNQLDVTLTQGGVHTLVLRDQSHVSIGGYTVDVQCLSGPCAVDSNPRVMQYGDTVRDELEVPGARDTFTFTGAPGDTILISGVRPSGGDITPCLILVSPANNRSTSCEPGPSNRLDVVLDEGGSYQVEVYDDTGTQAGVYSLSLERLRPASVGARPLSYAYSLPGDIDPEADVDHFTFVGQLNSIVRINAIGGTAQVPLHPCIELISPDNTRLSNCGTSAPSRIETTLNQSGTYSVLVHRRRILDGEVTLTPAPYRVDLQCLIGCGSDGRPIAFGQTQSYQIAPGQTDVYSFTAAAGDWIVMRVSGMSGCVELISPTNERQTACGGDGFLYATLTSTGTFRAVVSNQASSSTRYAVSLERLRPPTNAQMLRYGDTINEGFDFGDLDLYTFTAAANDLVRLRARRLTERFLLSSPVLRLIAPDGTEIPMPFPLTDLHLTQAGLYTVLAYDFGFEPTLQARAYGLDLQCLVGECPGAVGIRPIAFGETLVDAFDPHGDTDQYTFSANAGDLVHIAVADVPSDSLFPQGCLELWSTTGRIVEQTCTGRIDALIQATGQYRILATVPFYESYGPYTLTLERIYPAVGARPITYGQVVADAFDQSGDIDLFTFKGAFGDVIAMNVSSSASFPSTCVELVYSVSVRQRSCLTTTPNRLQVTLQGSGLFTFFVSGRIGGYSVELSCVSGTCPPGPPRNLAATVTGNSVALTWLAPLEGNPPTSYVVETGRSSGAMETTRDTMSSSTSFTMTVPDGTHFIRVRAGNVTGVGPASNEVIVSTTVVPGPPRNLAATVTSNSVALTWLAPLEGDPPTSYVVETGRSAGATETTINTGTSVTTFTITVPDGSHFIRVRARNAAGTGPVSNEHRIIAGSGGCAGPPSTPVGLTHSVTGLRVTLGWQPSVGFVRTYVLEVGSSAGASDLTVFETGNPQTSLVAMAPPGIYFVRVRATNACGVSAASNEQRVAIGQPCAGPPGAPTALRASVVGSSVTVAWNPAEGEVLGYILAVGSSSGANDVAILDLGDVLTLAGTVPPGTYFARTHARNACGVGSPSNEITVVVH